jgi:hypothetical protein
MKKAYLKSGVLTLHGGTRLVCPFGFAGSQQSQTYCVNECGWFNIETIQPLGSVSYQVVKCKSDVIAEFVELCEVP